MAKSGKRREGGQSPRTHLFSALFHFRYVRSFHYFPYIHLVPRPVLCVRPQHTEQGQRSVRCAVEGEWRVVLHDAALADAELDLTLLHDAATGELPLEVSLTEHSARLVVP